MGAKKYIVIKDPNYNTVLSATNDLNGVIYLYFAYNLSKNIVDLKQRIYNVVLFKYIFLKYDLLNRFDDKRVLDFYKSVEKMYHYHGLNNTNIYNEMEQLISSFIFQYKNEDEEEMDSEKKKEELIKKGDIKYFCCYQKEDNDSLEPTLLFKFPYNETGIVDLYCSLTNRIINTDEKITLMIIADKMIDYLLKEKLIDKNYSLINTLRRIAQHHSEEISKNGVDFKKRKEEIEKTLIFKGKIIKSIENDPELFIDCLFTSKETTDNEVFINTLKSLFKDVIKNNITNYKLIMTRLQIIIYEIGYFELDEALENLEMLYTDEELIKIFINKIKDVHYLDGEGNARERDKD